MFPTTLQSPFFPSLSKPNLNSVPQYNIDLSCHDSLEDAEINTSIWTTKDSDTLALILLSEASNFINPNYLSQSQPYLTTTMRAVLYDWIFEVSSELCMKRDTTYHAMSYIDRLLSKVGSIKKENYQLIGLTALYVAAKLEEIYPCKISDFARAADNGYSVNTIKITENFLVSTLKWRLTEPTVYSVTNWLMSQWDSFLNFHFGHVPQNNPDFFVGNQDLEGQKAFEVRYVSFKLANHVSYRRFRETMQVLDAFCLGVECLRYSCRAIAAGIVFLAVLEYFRQTGYELIVYRTEFGEMRYENSDLQTVVENLLNDFIVASLSFKNLDEVCPAASALFPFFKIELNNGLPPVCKFQTKQRLEAHYEEFLSYQTHNPNSLTFIKAFLKHTSL